MAKLKLNWMFAALVVTTLVVLGAKLYGAVQEAKSLTKQINQLHAVIATKQAEVTHLADTVELIEFANRQLLAERQSIAAITAQADAEKARLRIELSALNSQVQQLRVSSNETISDWANTVMPVDAVRLLKYADKGRNSHSYSDETEIHNPTGRAIKHLST